MSEREEFTQALADIIREMRRWTAPYGIIVGMHAEGRGKVRTITFGVARLLDATVKVYSSSYIVLESQGPMAQFGSPITFRTPRDAVLPERESAAAQLLDFIKKNWVFDDARY